MNDELKDILDKANPAQAKAILSYVFADGLWPHEFIECSVCGEITDAKRGFQPSKLNMAQSMCPPCGRKRRTYFYD